MPEGNKEKELEEKITRLEEKIKRLEGEKTPEEEEEESVAGGLLEGVGKMFGLGGLLKGIAKSPAFKERLEKIDEEVERKLRETPLKRVEVGRPTVRKDFSARPLAKGKPSPRKEPPPPPKEREVDVFDEQDYVLVVAEIPGAVEESIDVKLEKDKLTIQADKAGKKYQKELILPCVPEGELTKTYKNGILEVKITKKPVTNN